MGVEEKEGAKSNRRKGLLHTFFNPISLANAKDFYPKRSLNGPLHNPHRSHYWHFENERDAIQPKTTTTLGTHRSTMILHKNMWRFLFEQHNFNLYLPNRRCWKWVNTHMRLWIAATTLSASIFHRTKAVWSGTIFSRNILSGNLLESLTVQLCCIGIYVLGVWSIGNCLTKCYLFHLFLTG